MKVCIRCKIAKPEDTVFFHKSGNYLRADCKSCVNKQSRQYNKTHKEEISLRRKKKYFDNPSIAKEEMKGRREKLRLLIIKEYGGRCVCKHGKKLCGESTPEFLSIDHINGGGNKHRQELNRFGSNMYYWLKKNNYPKDNFQLLCFNCNLAKGHYGGCPHNNKTKREEQCKQINGPEL